MRTRLPPLRNREIGVHLAAARLISLDHDLVSPVAAPDPGDGLDVTKFLVSQPIVRPVIVRSANSVLAPYMMGAFELARWPCTRIPPLGDDWIESDWLPQVVRILHTQK